MAANLLDFDLEGLAAFCEGLGEKRFRAQENFYRDARKAAKAREHERAMTFEPHVPK